MEATSTNPLTAAGHKSSICSGNGQGQHAYGTILSGRDVVFAQRLERFGTFHVIAAALLQNLLDALAVRLVIGPMVLLTSNAAVKHTLASGAFLERTVGAVRLAARRAELWGQGRRAGIVVTDRHGPELTGDRSRSCRTAIA
jgi:hypothetical protein